VPVTVPLVVITVKFPVVAPEGMVTRIEVEEKTVYDTFAPFKRTEVTLLNPEPEIKTVFPIVPDKGATPEMKGAT
jgi:hypothetical protein